MRARRRQTTRAGRRVAAAAVLAVGLVLTVAFAGVTSQANALARNIDDLHAQIATEQARNEQLQASAAQKKSTDYIVDKAKDFGFVWPWEMLIAVQRDAAARTNAMPAEQRPPRLARWIALFAGTR